MYYKISLYNLSAKNGQSTLPSILIYTNLVCLKVSSLSCGCSAGEDHLHNVCKVLRSEPPKQPAKNMK